MDMDIDLRWPSGEHEKEEGLEAIDSMLKTDEKLQPLIKSPSPFEKCVWGVFKKFHVEIVGVVACQPKVDKQDESGITSRVHDRVKEQFPVTWNETKSKVSCMCLLFESRGYLCRHALVVLQMCSLTAILSTYILKRCTKDAKSRDMAVEEPEQLQSRIQ